MDAIKILKGQIKKWMTIGLVLLLLLQCGCVSSEEGTEWLEKKKEETARRIGELAKKAYEQEKEEVEKQFAEGKKILAKELEKKYGIEYKLLDLAGDGDNDMSAKLEDEQGNKFRAHITLYPEKNKYSYEDDYFQYVIREELKEYLEQLLPDDFPEHRIEIHYRESAYYPNSLVSSSGVDEFREQVDSMGLYYVFYLKEENMKEDFVDLSFKYCLKAKKERITGGFSFYIIKKEDWTDLNRNLELGKDMNYNLIDSLEYEVLDDEISYEF